MNNAITYKDGIDVSQGQLQHWYHTEAAPSSPAYFRSLLR